MQNTFDIELNRVSVIIPSGNSCCVGPENTRPPLSVGNINPAPAPPAPLAAPGPVT